ncbi:MAG: right-handed parallel beta-helix repeat-containing protein [Owenweeksia sp.]|nr:right-handed parallel beta-helix repeat-containing protein [Owenweeksia sp.]
MTGFRTPIPPRPGAYCVTNNSDSVTIDSCTIVMDSSTTGFDISAVLISDDYENDLGEGAGVDYLTVSNSTIIGGYYAINLEGNGTNDFGLGHVISGNTFMGFDLSGIYVDDLQDFTFTGNTLQAAAAATADGFYAFDLNDYTIEGNTINVQDYGLYISDGNDGFTPSSNSTIINNMVSSSSDYGMYLNDVVKTDVYHNTSVGSPGIAINDDEDLDIKNNIFVSDADFAFESLDDPDISTTIDYNLYYKSGAGNAFEILSTTYTDLAAWQTGDPSRNVNSLEGDPVFVSATDLHLIGGLANDVGDNSVGVTMDIDGDTRPASGATAVDIGADEYTPPAGDLELIAADFIKGPCLTTNDSIELLVQNLVSAVDFSVDPLTAN